MKFISWNVNGLRACLKKGFEDTFNALDADFFCVQETKMQPGQADFAPAGYTEYIYSAEKKGYSGTKPTAMRVAPSRWNTRTFTWSTSMCPTPKTSWLASIIACSGRMTCVLI